MQANNQNKPFSPLKTDNPSLVSLNIFSSFNPHTKLKRKIQEHWFKNKHFLSVWFGKERSRWLGPSPYDYPAYLTGELPGDYGFDIAGLGKDPVAFKNFPCDPARNVKLFKFALNTACSWCSDSRSNRPLSCLSFCGS